MHGVLTGIINPRLAASVATIAIVSALPEEEDAKAIATRIHKATTQTSIQASVVALWRVLG